MCATSNIDEDSKVVSSQSCHVYLMNDDFNMREYVARVLMMVCYISSDEAANVMMEANWSYTALIGTWEKPLAEHIFEGLTKAGLHAVMRDVDEAD